MAGNESLAHPGVSAVHANKTHPGDKNSLRTSRVLCAIIAQKETDSRGPWVCSVVRDSRGGAGG